MTSRDYLYKIYQKREKVSLTSMGNVQFNWYKKVKVHNVLFMFYFWFNYDAQEQKS